MTDRQVQGTASVAKTAPIANTVSDLRTHVATWRARGETVALVPTMGALHQGHLSLIDLASRTADHTIVSIYVNPTQFAPSEDFASYPRTFETDVAEATAAGCDLVWAPAETEMYPNGFATMVVPEGAAADLESVARPDFFTGVATVCTKLFIQTGADYAVFGEKDFQQLAVIRQIVRDLNLPIKIIGHATVRESDGLAMSSRNAYLTPEQRKVAPILHRTLQQMAAQIRLKKRFQDIEKNAQKEIITAGFGRVDYMTIRDAKSLEQLDSWVDSSGTEVRILAAAVLGTTRLIDNIGI